MRRHEMVYTTEQTDGQHQTDSHGPRRVQWAPSNLGPGSPQYPLVPAAPGSSPGPKWLPRHWTPVSPCCPKDHKWLQHSRQLLWYQGPSGSDKSRPLTHSSICWLQQPQVVSTNASSLPSSGWLPWPQAAPWHLWESWTLANPGPWSLSQPTPMEPGSWQFSENSELKRVKKFCGHYRIPSKEKNLPILGVSDKD